MLRPCAFFVPTALNAADYLSRTTLLPPQASTGLSLTPIKVLGLS